MFGDDGLHLFDLDTDRWESVETEQVFAVPSDASFARLSPDGSVMAWIVDEVAYLQRVGEQPVVWRDGVAEIWFAVSAG